MEKATQILNKMEKGRSLTPGERRHLVSVNLAYWSKDVLGTSMILTDEGRKVLGALRAKATKSVA